jgi:hypothetical protein
MNNLIKLLPKRTYAVGYWLQHTYKEEDSRVVQRYYDDFDVAYTHYLHLEKYFSFTLSHEETQSLDTTLFKVEPFMHTHYMATKFTLNDFTVNVDEKYDEDKLYSMGAFPSDSVPKILLQLYDVWGKDWWTRPIEEYNIFQDILYHNIFTFLYRYFNEVDEQDVHPDIVNWLKSNPY